MKLHMLAAVTVVALGSVSASAAILVDQSPDTLGLSFYQDGYNQLQSGFAPRFGFTLTRTTQLTGIDIYSECPIRDCPRLIYPLSPIPRSPRPMVGGPGTLALFYDLGGTDYHAISPISYEVVTISAIDSIGATTYPALRRIHADFDHSLAPGNYFISLMGDNINLGKTLSGTPTGQRIFWGSDSFGANYSMPYTIYGSVPEPASWAMMIAGFGMTGASLRRRRTERAA